MTKLKTFLGRLGCQFAKPWVFGVICSINAALLLATPSDQFGKLTAFLLGVNVTAAIYNFVYQRMNSRRDSMLQCLEEQRDVIHSLTEMKTHEIGQQIAEHMGAVMVERPNITKH